MIEEERLFYRIYSQNYKPPLTIQKVNSNGKVRIYISCSNQKPTYGNADIVFSEDKKKILFYPKKSKKGNLFNMEYVYLTIHSLSESLVNLKVFFENQQNFEGMPREGSKISLPILRQKDSTIKERNNKFVDDLMKKPVKRRKFMKSIHDIKTSRSERLSKSRN